jgi:hypothetical protein
VRKRNDTMSRACSLAVQGGRLSWCGLRDAQPAQPSRHTELQQARLALSTSAHHASPVGSCGCDHERRSTASRACSMADIRRPISGRLLSSSVKFGAPIGQITHRASSTSECPRAPAAPGTPGPTINRSGTQNDQWRTTVRLTMPLALIVNRAGSARSLASVRGRGIGRRHR